MLPAGFVLQLPSGNGHKDPIFYPFFLDLLQRWKWHRAIYCHLFNTLPIWNSLAILSKLTECTGWLIENDLLVLNHDMYFYHDKIAIVDMYIRKLSLQDENKIRWLDILFQALQQQ